MIQKVLRRPAVQVATGLSRSTLYALMEQGKFPKPVPISERAVGWLESEIETWQKERILKRDGQTIAA